jgi:alanine racemase
MRIQLLSEFRRQWISIFIRRVISIIFLISTLFITTASNTEHKNGYVTDKIYNNYPQELISYIRQQGQLYNSAERKSETYVEIDQLAYYDNIQLIKKRILKDSCRLMVVLKSDAYGNGIEYLGKVSEFAGVDYIGVTENKEILKLRSLNIKIPVLRIRLASDNELTTVHTNSELFGEVEEMVGTLRMARYLSKVAMDQNKIIKVHISLNSGEMSRDGFDMGIPGTRDSLILLLKLNNICIRGIMTHFANAETEDIGELRKLLSEFLVDADWIISKGGLKRRDIILHAAASALTLRVPESHLDMVRLGSITYGEKTAEESPEELKPLMSLYSSIGQILFYHAGSKVGYGSTYQLDKDSYLANVPIGKNNGVPPNLEYALVKGQRVRVVGALSMNATMIDITPLYNQVRNGDQVVFIGKQGNEEITAEEISKSTGVESWTLHCNVGQLNYDARYPKKLIN